MTTTPLPRTSAQIRLAHANDRITKLEQSCADLEAENQRLRTALVWIEKRCPRIFLEQPPHKIHWEAANDAGACARSALKGSNHD